MQILQMMTLTTFSIVYCVVKEGCKGEEVNFKISLKEVQTKNMVKWSLLRKLKSDLYDGVTLSLIHI